MDKKKIIVVGAGSAGINEALLAKLYDIANVELISPEAAQELRAEYDTPRDIISKADLLIPKIEPAYFKPPITRRERRAQQRKR